MNTLLMSSELLQLKINIIIIIIIIKKNILLFYLKIQETF